MKSKILLVITKIFIVILVLCSSFARAQKISNCSASPYPVNVKQADGSTLTIVGKGTMLNPWAETADGYPVVKKNGVYEYARKSGGKLVPTGIVARNAKERKPEEVNFLKQQPKSQKPDAPSFKGKPGFYPAASGASGPAHVGYPSTGNVKALMLLIKYPDMPNTYASADFNNLMNQANYRGTGSFRDFYTTSSFGKLNITTDVFGWYTAAHPYSHYGYDNDFYVSTDLVREAVDAAQAAGVNFANYDNDHDGVVDGIVVAHAGPGAEEGSQGQYVWSHRWVLSGGNNQVTYDGVLIDDYIINPERRLYTGQMVGRGIFCHEFGHNLGMPDLYDTDGSSEGLGEWSLMASASWLGNEHTPGNMCAWSRQELNWLTPTVLNAAGSYALNAASGSNQVYRINTPNANEYFLLENRQQTGLDVSLNGTGLAIWHINTNKTTGADREENKVNADENLKGVDLEEADGQNDLDNGWNRGDGGDLFPGYANNIAFNDITDPDAKTYTGVNTKINISAIAEDGTGKISFSLNFSGVAPPAITSFAPAAGAVGVGVAIKGTSLNNVTAVKFNGVEASEIYVAGPTLVYATVPYGATSGKIEVIAGSSSSLSATNFTVGAISSPWVAKAGLANARSQHGAVAANGKIYVFGGSEYWSDLTSLEIYNPATNTWTAGAPMPDASRGMSYALGSDGMIYVISGFNYYYNSTDVYRYNPATNTWTTLASFPDGVWEGAAASTANGKVYVFGGEPTDGGATNATRIYNIATNTWSSGANMPTGVQQHSAITGNDGKIYVFGGRIGENGVPLDIVQIYNPATNTWASGAAMPIAKTQFGAVKASNGNIYIVGGKAKYNNNEGPFFHTVEIYNPTTNTWTTGPVIRAQAGELEAVNLNGNLHAIGGTDGTYRNYNFQLSLGPTVTGFTPATGAAGTGVAIRGTKFTNVTAVRFNGVAAPHFYVASATLLYATVPAGATTGKVEVVAQDGAGQSTANFTVSPISSIWVAKTGVTTARSQHGAVAANGNIYVFGGFNGTSSLNTVAKYNPAANTWSAGAPMPAAARGMSFTLGTDGMIYAVSGINGTTYSTAAFRYNPATNTWATIAAMPAGVFEGAAASSNGKIYVFGGQPSGAAAASNATRIYTIATNTWSVGANMPSGMMQHSAVTGNDGRIYVIGGRNNSGSAPSGTVQIYNPTTNTWSSGAAMTIAKVQFGAVKAGDGRIYVVGGKVSHANNAAPFFHTVEIYNPANNTWAAGPVIPAPIGEQEAVNLNDNLYTLAGTNGTVRNFNYQLQLPPAAPAGLTATVASSTQINLAWTDKSLNETNFVVERATAAAGPFTVIAPSLAANSVSYASTGLVAGTTYYYRVKATNTAGSSAYSNVASAATYGAGVVAAAAAPATVFEEQRNPQKGLSVYPNPVATNTRISFSVDEDMPVQLDVYDMKGMLVDQVFKGTATAGKMYQFVWNAGSHPAGVYISRLATRKGVFSEKFILLSGNR